ncbi:MAG: hypothetical protein EAZ35_00695 [Sphingobacteriia bacterium]|nr:MAG: hypothetical protein EAZ35_00695 [Sphingobacteriia bacterium]
MRFLLLPLFTFLCLYAESQCKTYRLGANRDTLNCTDMTGMKQGKWIVNIAKLRGEPGYEEEGVFLNNRKEGLWRRYNLMGDLLAQENFKWGNKNGRCMYFTFAGLEHEESWRAVNPDKAYDTLDVQDLRDPNKYDRIIVKTDGTSIKHGTWKFYIPETSVLINMEEYVMGQLKEPTDPITGNTIKVIIDTVKTSSLPAPSRPKLVTEFEQKHTKKKKPARTGKTSPPNSQLP